MLLKLSSSAGILCRVISVRKLARKRKNRNEPYKYLLLLANLTGLGRSEDVRRGREAARQVGYSYLDYYKP